jgi:hemin uptake protein HemP
VGENADHERVGPQSGPGPSDGRPGQGATARPPAVSSDALLRGGRELVIRHSGEEYRLRLTGNNKLILTK